MPQVTIDHHRGVPIVDRDPSGVGAALDAVAGADLAVVAVGDLAALFGRGTSGEGCDAEDLRLPGLQGDLVEAALATGTPVVLVVVSGRPYALGDYADRCAAVIQAFMPGEEGGGAIARVLTGEVNPSGRLPVGIPRTPGGQPGTYLAPILGRNSEGISNLDPTPLYPFGFGLSYTDFRYDRLTLSAVDIPTDGTILVSVDVTNDGPRAGDDVVQLYLSDEIAQVTRPVRQLIGYTRVSLEPGCSTTIEFEVHADRTTFCGVGLRRVVEPGDIVLSIGHSSEDLPLTARARLHGPVRNVGRPVLVTPVRLDVPRARAH
jgi:beta-glucosidase